MNLFTMVYGEKQQLSGKYFTKNPIVGLFLDWEIEVSLGKTFTSFYSGKYYLLRSQAWEEDSDGNILRYFPFVVSEIVAPPCKKC